MNLNKQLISYYYLKRPDTLKKRMKCLNVFYLMVEKYWKDKIEEKHLPPDELKKLIDLCFDEWDKFVTELFIIDLKMANICYHHSYRVAFMNNKEMKRIYDGL